MGSAKEDLPDPDKPGADCVWSIVKFANHQLSMGVVPPHWLYTAAPPNKKGKLKTLVSLLLFCAVFIIC